MTRDAGFTLLEILVALAVFGLLMGGLARGVDFGLRAWDRQGSAIAARSELDAVDRALRGLIARLDPAAEVVGDAHAMTFASRLPRGAATTPLPRGAATTAEVDVALGVDDARRLVLRWTPHLHAERLAPPPAPETAELLRGVGRLDLAYWPRGGGGGWRESWTSHDLPALVRVRVSFPPGDPRHWADLVTAVMRDTARD